MTERFLEVYRVQIQNVSPHTCGVHRYDEEAFKSCFRVLSLGIDDSKGALCAIGASKGALLVFRFVLEHAPSDQVAAAALRWLIADDRHRLLECHAIDQLRLLALRTHNVPALAVLCSDELCSRRCADASSACFCSQPSAEASSAFLRWHGSLVGQKCLPLLEAFARLAFLAHCECEATKGAVHSKMLLLLLDCTLREPLSAEGLFALFYYDLQIKPRLNSFLEVDQPSWLLVFVLLVRYIKPCIWYRLFDLLVDAIERVDRNVDGIERLHSPVSAAICSTVLTCSALLPRRSFGAT